METRPRGSVRSEEELYCFLIVVDFTLKLPPPPPSLSAVVFGRDSLFMTGFLAIMTILLRAMNRYRGDMPNWLTSLHNTLSNAQIYRFLLVNGAPAASVTSSSGNQIEKIEQQQPDDDGAVLVEMRKSETAYSSTESLWPTIALFIDRIVLIVFVCAYLALILTWLPSEVSRKDAMQALGIEDK